MKHQLFPWGSLIFSQHPDKVAGKSETRYWSPENIPVLVEKQAICIIHTVQDITELDNILRDIIGKAQPTYLLL
ncbi:hypothetical protein GZH53_10170 [Flavihumibacter sp. R14]|nr:hypothetical protein [Flavihumibacter soli]